MRELFDILTHAIRLGYNHAHEVRPITLQDVNKAKSKKFSQYVLQNAKL